MKANDTIGRDDPFDLTRFTRAQESIYGNVLAELRSGQKRVSGGKPNHEAGRV